MRLFNAMDRTPPFISLTAERRSSYPSGFVKELLDFSVADSRIPSTLCYIPSYRPWIGKFGSHVERSLTRNGMNSNSSKYMTTHAPESTCWTCTISLVGLVELSIHDLQIKWILFAPVFAHTGAIWIENRIGALQSCPIRLSPLNWSSWPKLLRHSIL